MRLSCSAFLSLRPLALRDFRPESDRMDEADVSLGFVISSILPASASPSSAWPRTCGSEDFLLFFSAVSRKQVMYHYI